MLKFISVLLIFFSIILLFSCATMPQTINPEWSGDILFKNAQEAMDNNNLKTALFYYEVFLVRYPENFQKSIAAEYERSFIQYKMKKYDEAEEGFRSILDKYKNSPFAMMYPSRFKTLSEISLENIAKQKYVGNRLFWRMREKKWAEEHGEELLDTGESTTE